MISRIKFLLLMERKEEIDFLVLASLAMVVLLVLVILMKKRKQEQLSEQNEDSSNNELANSFYIQACPKQIQASASTIKENEKNLTNILQNLI